jgi:hypothetical protein
MSTPVAELQPGALALIGLGTDDNSSFMRGPAAAPPAIRAALYGGATNLTTEAGIDLAAMVAVKLLKEIGGKILESV